MKPIVTTYSIKVTDPDNQPDHRVRIALLCDLHNASFGSGQKILTEMVIREHPAAVLSAGDLVTAKGGRCHFDNALTLIASLSKHCPVYLSQGNHELRMQEQTDRYKNEFEAYRAGIQSSGAHLLDNASAKIRCAGMRMTVSGFSASLQNYRKLEKQPVTARQIEEAVGRPDPGRFTLLLAHYPDYLDAYSEWGADLVLSGHVHGGTVRLPFVGGLIAPDFRLLPRYDKGLYRKGGTLMAVGTGLGCHTIKLRINNPPELVMIDLIPAKTE